MLFSLDKISLKIRIVEKERVNKNKNFDKRKRTENNNLFFLISFNRKFISANLQYSKHNYCSNFK